MNSEKNSSSCLKELIFSSKLPVVFSDSIDWDILKWSVEDWSNALQDKLLSFRCGQKICQKTPVWESQCKTENYTFEEFVAFSRDVNLIDKKWWYFDYKHIPEHFSNEKDIFSTLSWRRLGFPDKGAEDSTIWIGSAGAHTACHFDSYGCNIVAQVLGTKRWILFPPSEIENLKPTRLPYEESSIYSSINFTCAEELKENLKFANCFTVDLNPGEVLLIPPKWWHFVENLSLAISVNMWIPVQRSDDVSRLDEALVKYFISNIINGIPQDYKTILLNPNERDLKMETTDLDIIEFCKKKCKEVPNSSLVETKIDSHCVGSHCHKYRILRSISITEFRNMLPNCIDYHRVHHSEKQSSEDHTNTLTSVINAFCHPDIICQIRNKILS